MESMGRSSRRRGARSSKWEAMTDFARGRVSFLRSGSQRLLSGALVALIISSALASAQPVGAGEANRGGPPFSIRVLIARDFERVTIRSGEPMTFELGNGATLSRAGAARIGKRAGRLTLNGARLSDSEMTVRSKGALRYNGAEYSGSFEFIVTRAGSLLINHVDLEDYLLGVVAAEMSDDWPIEALKAQAVASRSYALFHKFRSAGRAYDALATVDSQVYNGAPPLGAKNIERAVGETRGETLVFNGEIAEALFHSSSGGRTEDISDVWNSEERAYLRSRPSDDSASPYDRWSVGLSERRIRSSLRSDGYDVGPISYITPDSYTRSGRIKELRIISNHPSKLLILPAIEFRRALGPRLIKSTRFHVSLSDGNYFNFTGSGYGHGVGMSQYAAMVMAERGADYREILAHFYRGARIEHLPARSKSDRVALRSARF